MKIDSNIDINKDHNKLSPDVPKTVIPAVRRDPVGATKLQNLKMLTKKHNDEKLTITFLIVGVGLIAYHFWYKILLNWHYYSHYFPLSLAPGLMH